MKQSTASPWLILFAFFNIYVIWGSTYLAVAFGLQGLPPFLLITLRYLIAGIILLIYSKLKGEKLPPRSVMSRQAFSGILMLVGGTGMIAWAEQYISSGQAAILIATEPLWFLVLDKKRWSQYFSNWLIVAGLLIGFVGIFLFLKLGHDQNNTSSISLIAACIVLLSAVWWVVGSLIIKNTKSSSSSIMTSSVQLLAAGVASLVLSVSTKELYHFSFDKVSLVAWSGLIFLIVMGSLIAYLSYVWLISVKPPALVSTHTYVNPVVAVFLGWFFAHENINTGQILSLFVILAGILLVNIPAYQKTTS